MVGLTCRVEIHLEGGINLFAEVILVVPQPINAAQIARTAIKERIHIVTETGILQQRAQELQRITPPRASGERRLALAPNWARRR